MLDSRKGARKLTAQGSAGGAARRRSAVSRAISSPVLMAADSSAGPYSRQKIPLHRQLADLRVKITDLALSGPDGRPARPRSRHDLSPRPSIAVALGVSHVTLNLVDRMNLVLRGDLLKRPDCEQPTTAASSAIFALQLAAESPPASLNNYLSWYPPPRSRPRRQ